MDDKVIDRIDEVAGRRGRSRFLEQAAKEKLARMRLVETLHETAGAVSSDHPDWGDSPPAAEWVRKTRTTESTLAPALQTTDQSRNASTAQWISRPMETKVDLEDKEALREALDGR